MITDERAALRAKAQRQINSTTRGRRDSFVMSISPETVLGLLDEITALEQRVETDERDKDNVQDQLELASLVIANGRDALYALNACVANDREEMRQLQQQHTAALELIATARESGQMRQAVKLYDAAIDALTPAEVAAKVHPLAEAENRGALRGTYMSAPSLAQGDHEGDQHGGRP